MTRRHLIRAILVLGAVHGPAADLAAQGRGMSGTSGGRRDPRDWRTTAGIPESGVRPVGEAVHAPAMVVTGLPRSFQVVAVPIPETLPLDRAVSYEVLQGGDIAILGSQSGVIPAGPAGRRALLFTVPVPASSRSGPTMVATVRFRAPGAAAVEVPILLEVAQVQRLELVADEALRAVRPGEGFTLRFHLANLGNGPDTAEVRVLAPTGWRVSEPAPAELAAIPLDVHAVVQRAVTIRVPAGSSTGSASVRLIALVHEQPVATTDVPVLVLESGFGSSRAGDGPRLTLGAGVVGGSWGSPLTAYTAALDGQLTSDIRVSGRTTVVPGRRADGLYALSRAGLYPVSPTLLLSAPAWRLGLGLTGAKLSDLSGVNVGGRGAALDLIRPRWTGSAFLARPDYGDQRAEGELAGGRLDVRLGAATLSGTASHLADGGPEIAAAGSDPRRLDALELGASVPGVFQGILETDLARRWFDQGAALGWSAAYERREPTGQIGFRLSHAPGGTAAFARATDELSASAGRSFGRLLLHAGTYRNADASRVGLTSLVTSGWTLGSQLRIGEATTAGAELRRSSFDARGAAGDFGNAETAAGASLSVRQGDLFGTLNGSLAFAERRTVTPGGMSLLESVSRQGAQAVLGVGGAAGLLELTARLDHGGAAAGFLARQAQLGLRAERVPVLAGRGGRLLASGSVERLTWFGDREGLTALTAGLRLELAGGTALDLSAERNPFILTAAGGGGWFYGLKMERAVGLPRLPQPETRGTVFKDQNGNGVRDADEPGFAGVLVRRGKESVVTGKDGSFRLSGQATDPPAIDPLSLPLGWIQEPSRTAGSGSDLGVAAVAAIEVALEVASDTLGRISSSRLAGAIVLAHDEHNHVWVGRAAAPGHAVFDALPPGRYRIELDLSDVQEPLTPAERLPEFVVQGAGVEATRRLVVTLRARPVHLKQLGPPRGSAPRGGDPLS